MNIPDNSKFEQMVKNRPSASILPSINKRLLSQFLGRSSFATASFVLFGGIFIYKFMLNANSGPFLKSRQSFNFEADPYSGKVRCTHQSVPNYEHGY